MFWSLCDVRCLLLFDSCLLSCLKLSLFLFVICGVLCFLFDCCFLFMACLLCLYSVLCFLISGFVLLSCFLSRDLCWLCVVCQIRIGKDLSVCCFGFLFKLCCCMRFMFFVRCLIAVVLFVKRSWLVYVDC